MIHIHTALTILPTPAGINNRGIRTLYFFHVQQNTSSIKDPVQILPDAS